MKSSGHLIIQTSHQKSLRCIVRNEKQSEFVPDLLQHHPPERREQKKKYVVLYSCCCCCCCCLHTLGSAIGVATVKNFKSDPNVLSAQSMFWISTLAANVLTLIGVVFYGHDPGVMLIIAAVFGPLILLGACLLMAIWIAATPSLPERGKYYRNLLRITVGNVVGCVVGIAVMWLIAVCLS